MRVRIFGDAGGAETVAADAHADACRFGQAADHAEDIALPHRVARQAPRPAGHEGHLVLSAPASLAAAALATEVSVFDLDPAGLLPARLGQPHRDD